MPRPAHTSTRAASQAGPRAWLRPALILFAVAWGANQIAPMLLVYRRELGFSDATLDTLFGVYVVGLVPGLLLGGRTSDRIGRRPVVLLFGALSPLASLLLMTAGGSVALMVLGRLLAGTCTGVVFGSASAWVQELSEGTAPGVAARRATVAASTGFGCGAIATGVLGQWGPTPLWLPYVPHVTVGVVALLLGLRAAETVRARTSGPLLSLPRAVLRPRFALVVAPLAPWVFGLTSISCVTLPQLVGHREGAAIALSGAANAVTLIAGVAAQPFARVLERRRRLGAGLFGMVAGAAGIAVGIVAVAAGSPLLGVVAAAPLGIGYGMTLVSGLSETERLASPHELGATIAVFLSLTYVGAFFPYLIVVAGQSAGDAAALTLFALLLAACLALSLAASRRAAREPCLQAS